MNSDAVTPRGETVQPVEGDEAEAPAVLPAGRSDFRGALWVAASELIVDLGYTSRSHFVNGQSLRARAKWLEVPRVVFPVVASAGTATFALFGLTGVAVVFGFGAALAIALEKVFDPIANANAHTDKADRLLTVCKDLRYFRNVTLRSPASEAELERTLTQLRKRADDLRKLEPRQVPQAAYDQARRQIADGQAQHRDDPLWQDPPADL
jgi:hypothetical protein